MGLVKVDVTPVAGTILKAMPHTADRRRILRGLGAAARAHWVSLAQKQLKSTARDYVAGIQETFEDDKVLLVLTGRVPNMVEQGFDGGDMRAWLLKGPNAKMGKNGPYNIIPFRHGTPGTTGRNVGRTMPKPIHNAAKRLAPTLSRPGAGVGKAGGRTVAYGERLHPGRRMSAQAKKILTKREKPWHATSIYHGMIRHGKEFGKKGRVQTTGYQTFRTISSVSRGPKHWWHPGIKARNLAKQVDRHVEVIADTIVKSALGH